MEEVKTNSQLSQVSNKMCEEEPLKADVKVIIKNEGFITFDIEINKVAADGGSYLADICEVKINGQTKDGPKILNLFVKNKIQHDIITFSTDEAYKAETFAYRELFPVFKELEDEFNVPQCERYRAVKYYDTGNEDVIIMDNITKQGYKVLDRLKLITLQYAELGVLELAKFHALSFAIENHRPEFMKKVSTFKFPMKFNDHYNNFLRNAVNQSLELINPDKKERLLSKGFWELVNNLNLQWRKMENSVNCLCHNDYRVGNIMYHEQDGAIKDLIPLDFQLMAVGSPLNDFFFFLLPPTDKKFRSQHLDYLKEYYYKNLAKHLNYFNMNVNEVYEREEFDKDYKRCRIEYGLPICMNLLPIHLLPVDDFPDVPKQDIATLTIVKHDVLIDRLNDLVDDFIGWGYF